MMTNDYGQFGPVWIHDGTYEASSQFSRENVNRLDNNRRALQTDHAEVERDLKVFARLSAAASSARKSCAGGREHGDVGGLVCEGC